MNLVEFTVKNYKSLRHVKLDFGNYTALLGENGSGKTSALEALYLFFKDFNAVGGTPSTILHEPNSWYDRKLELEFGAKILLDEEECKDMFPEGLLDKVTEGYVGADNEFTILRRISRPGEPWETVYIRFGKVSLVKDNVVVPTEELIKAVSKVALKRTPNEFKAFLFDPSADQSNLIGDRFIVLDDTAYAMDDYTDGLVREGKIPFDHLPGEDFRA